MSTNPKTSNMANAKAGRIKTRLKVLAPVAGMVLAMVGFCAMFVSINTQDRITVESQEAFDHTTNAFRREWMADAEVMDAGLELISSDPSMVDTFASGDIKTLRAKAGPLLNHLGADRRMVHFRFHAPGPVSEPDIHKPDLAGKDINQHTLDSAKQTGTVALGLELEPQGALTVRVVHPLRDGDRIVGYLELAQEIEQITRRLKETQGMEFAIAINKELIDRNKWAKCARTIIRQTDWDRSATSVFVYKTMRAVPDEVRTHLDDESRNADAIRVSLGQNDYRATLRDLHDSAGRRIARIVIMRNVTSASAGLAQTVKHVSLACGAVGLAVVIFFYSLLGRIEKTAGDTNSPADDNVTAAGRFKKDDRKQHADQEPSIRTDNNATSEPLAQPTSIRSLYADDPDMKEIIGEFVGRLGAFVGEMALALDNNCHEELRRFAHQLKGAGGGYGYQSLTNTARTIEDAAKIKDSEAAKLAMNDLNELCKAIITGCNTSETSREIS